MSDQASKSIYLKNIPADLMELLDIVSENQYEKKAHLIRKFLRVITEQYPNEMKQDPPGGKRKHLDLQYVNPQIKKDLENIAANLGVQVNALIKMDLRKMIDQLPDNLKIKDPD